MLALFRRFLNTWAARGFFLILIGAFGLWGVGDVIRNLAGPSSAVATVDGQRIELPQVQEAYQQQMTQMTQMLAGRMQPTDEMRRIAARQALDQLITETALDAELRRLGVAVPDASVRQAVYQIPGFQQNGTFSRPMFDQLLRQNNMTEDHFVAMMRGDLGQRALLEAIAAGGTAPDLLVRRLYDYRSETRVASMVSFPFAAAAAPAAPTDAELQRWYDDHPDLYSAPEYRRIKAVILAPQLVARDIPVSDADIAAYYDAHKTDYVTPEKRSADVLVAQTEPVAQKLAAQWKSGADWTAMQAAAKSAGAASAELDTATAADFPSPGLAKAVFAAQPSTVTGPVKTDSGWDVLLVPKLVAGTSRTLDQVRTEIRDHVAADRAGDLIYDRASKLQDLLGSGATLDSLPANLGLAAVTGTLDAQGMTPEGKPAPIPGPADVRQALIAAAFTLKQGDPPALAEVPSQHGGVSSYYAVSVEGVVPPARKPFAAVQSDVRADWIADAEQHAQNVAATALYVAVRDGRSIQTAAAIDGLKVTETPAIARGSDTPGVPPQLAQIMFGLKQGEATMVQTADGFVVATLDRIEIPDPAKDPAGYAATRDALNRQMGGDLAATFTTALRARANPRINQSLLDTVTTQ